MFDIEKISNRSVWNISNLSEGEGFIHILLSQPYLSG